VTWEEVKHVLKIEKLDKPVVPAVSISKGG
jgi:hypothetical protein